METRAHQMRLTSRKYADRTLIKRLFWLDKTPPDGPTSGINCFTLMPDNAAPKTKRQHLQATGTFHPRAAQVRHPLFQQSNFFDPEDLLQVKYESLRATEKDDY